MPSIQDFVQDFRNRILARERKAASEMVRVYASAWERIKRRIYALNAEYERLAAKGQQPGLTWVYQSQRAIQLKLQISKELNTFAAYTEREITQLQEQAVKESLAFAEQASVMGLDLKPEYGVDIRWNKINHQAVIDMVGANQPGSPLSVLLSSIASAGALDAQNALIQGVLLGYNPRKIAPMIRDALGIQLDRALTISRTEVLRASREAAQEAYKANDAVVKGWVWLSALDDRVCPSCWAMHGTEYPNSEPFASHPNCRCTPAPLTYTWEEIGARYGVDLSDLDQMEGDRKYKTGEEVFRSLSEAEQRKILGPAKWLAWKEGKLEFSQLSKRTWSADWGPGRAQASLKEIVGGNEANYYKRFADKFLGRDYMVESGVRLTYERLGHIYDRHPEVNASVINDLMKKAILMPDEIVQSNSDPTVNMHYVADSDGKYWSFVIKTLHDDTFVLTVRRAHDKGK